MKQRQKILAESYRFTEYLGVAKYLGELTNKSFEMGSKRKEKIIEAAVRFLAESFGELRNKNFADKKINYLEAAVRFLAESFGELRNKSFADKKN